MYALEEGSEINQAYPVLEGRLGSGLFVRDSILVGDCHGNLESPKDQLK